MSENVNVMTCGTCGFQYPDNTPAGRCPREYDHPEPYPTPAERLASAVREVGALDSEMWSDNGGHFSCTEAAVIADLLSAVGLEHDATMLLTGHYYANSADPEGETEAHVDDGVRDSRIDPSIMWDEGTEPY